MHQVEQGAPRNLSLRRQQITDLPMSYNNRLVLLVRMCRIPNFMAQRKQQLSAAHGRCSHPTLIFHQVLQQWKVPQPGNFLQYSTHKVQFLNMIYPQSVPSNSTNTLTHCTTTCRNSSSSKVVTTVWYSGICEWINLQEVRSPTLSKWTTIVFLIADIMVDLLTTALTSVLPPSVILVCSKRKWLEPELIYIKWQICGQASKVSYYDLRSIHHFYKIIKLLWVSMKGLRTSYLL